MPRAPKVPFKNIIDVLSIHKSLLTNDGILQPPSHKVWSDIAEVFGIGTISPKYLWTICKMNRNRVLNHLGLIDDQQAVVDAEINSDVADDTSDSNSDHVRLKFNITLSAEEWKRIHPVVKTYRCQEPDRTHRNKFVFSTATWTDVFAVHFYEQTRLSCPINFKRSSIHPDSLEKFIKIDGYCNDCGSCLQIELDKEPLEDTERIVMTCIYTGDFNNCVSRKKRMLKGERRQDIIKKMRTEKLNPSVYRQLEARKVMVFGSQEPAFLPSGNVLRAAISIDKRDKRYNDDPVVSIAIMKSLSKFESTIHDIGYDPFYVYYWSPYQMSLYKTYVRDVDESRITIDATGGLVRPPVLTSKPTSKRTFLYEVTIQDTTLGIQCSVAHMLSAKHDNNSISNWLTNWHRAGAPIPKMIVTDQSLALIYAVVKTFTQFSTLRQYLDCCYSALNSNVDNLPSTMIRIDIAHTMKIFSTWPPLKNANKRVKEMYLSCLGKVLQSKSYGEVLLILKNMFIVMQSETEGLDDQGNETPCERAKSFLRNQIIHTLPYENSDDNDNDVEEIYIDIDKDNPSTCLFQVEVDNLAKNAAIGPEGDRVNAHFLPQLKEYVIRQSKYIPLWTNIMMPIFQMQQQKASSASTESNFNQLKHRICAGVSLPMRVDEFLEHHITHTEGAVNLTSANMKGIQNNEAIDLTTSVGVTTSSHTRTKEVDEAEESWKKRAQKKTSKYVSGNTAVDPFAAYYDQIPILTNSNHKDPIQFGSKRFHLVNSCGLDSLVHLLACHYVDKTQFRNWVHSQTNQQQKSIWDLVICLVQNGLKISTYRTRTLIAKEKLDQSLSVDLGKTSVTKLDMATTVKSVLETFAPEAVSLRSEINCSNCATRKKYDTKVVGVNVTDKTTIKQDLMKVIIDRFEEQCLCKKVIATLSFPSPLLFVEIVQDMNLDNDDFVQNPTKTMAVPLVQMRCSDLPDQLTVLNEDYNFIGAFCFSPGSFSENSIGHYFCIAKRGTVAPRFEIYDDLKSKVYNAGNKLYSVEILVFSKF